MLTTVIAPSMLAKSRSQVAQWSSENSRLMVNSRTSGNRQSRFPMSMLAFILPNCVIVVPVNTSRRLTTRPLLSRLRLNTITNRARQQLAGTESGGTFSDRVRVQRQILDLGEGVGPQPCDVACRSEFGSEAESICSRRYFAFWLIASFRCCAELPCWREWRTSVKPISRVSRVRRHRSRSRQRQIDASSGRDCGRLDISSATNDCRFWW
jgi:hypothetical protein